jgi:NADPH-dependent glutamate synthase beta subunit-like oxidoreductase
VEVLKDSGGAVCGVRVERTRLEPSPRGFVAVGTGEYETHEVQLVLKSIGYKSLPLAGVAFDARAGVIPNAAGRVLKGEAANWGGGEGGVGGGAAWGARCTRVPAARGRAACRSRGAGSRGSSCRAALSGRAPLVAESTPPLPAARAAPAAPPAELGGSEVEPGLYACGWVKRGPTGLIGTNSMDADETVDCIHADAPSLRARDVGGGAGLRALLAGRGVRAVGEGGWRRIDAEEVRRGRAVGKPREKLVTVDEMLQAAGPE